jgi:hypothetical protein
MSQPIVNAPLMYINGLKLSYATATTLTVGIGQCRDSTNTFDMVIASPKTIDAAVNGINGLDTGTFAASTKYHVFVIADSHGYNATGTILSLSLTAPELPFGYDLIRYIGDAISDGSTHFLPFYQYGLGTERTVFYDSMISVLSGGSSATYAAIDLSGAVPIAATEVILHASFTPNAAADIASIRPTGSSATTVMTISGVVAAKAQQMQLCVPSLISSAVPKIDYLVTASGALSLSVVGYRQYL